VFGIGNYFKIVDALTFQGPVDHYQFSRQSLTKVLTIMIQAGADVYAVDEFGRSPSHMAQGFGESHVGLEWCWQAALRICGLTPEDVYRKSGVSWTDQLHSSHAIIDILFLSRGICSWGRETLQDLLEAAIRASAVVTLSRRNYNTRYSLSHIAIMNGASTEHAWRTALEACGYNPRLIYDESGAQWEEFEEIKPPEVNGIQLTGWRRVEEPFDWSESLEHIRSKQSMRCVSNEGYESQSMDADTEFEDDSGTDGRRNSSGYSDDDIEDVVTGHSTGTTTTGVNAAPTASIGGNPPRFLEPHTIYSPIEQLVQTEWNSIWAEDTSLPLLPWQQERVTPATSLGDCTTGFVDDSQIWNMETLGGDDQWSQE
jgi:hypothetical protein